MTHGQAQLLSNKELIDELLDVWEDTGDIPIQSEEYDDKDKNLILLRQECLNRMEYKLKMTVVICEVGRGYENVYENVDLNFISIIVETLCPFNYIKIRFNKEN